MATHVPEKGQWPTDPQEDQEIKESRIWIDGCFDFFHHGHAGVMLQARQLGEELYVGIHSDEEILENKGPSVMNLQERMSASEACRWTTKCIPSAPYVTYLPWISHYGCQYVVHGDDISSDSTGEDTYRFVKRAGRFKVVKRTPGISTTDLVGRMLLCTTNHFIRSLSKTLDGEEGNASKEDLAETAKAMRKRMQEYATDETGLKPGVDVYIWSGSASSTSNPTQLDAKAVHKFERIIQGKGPKPGQRIVYVDGGFDLFSSGQIEFLRLVNKVEDDKARAAGWFDEANVKARVSEHGSDYPPAYVVAGIHDDNVINENKGLNYPIMNIYERGLCLLQCRYIHSVIFSAPFNPSTPFLHSLPTPLPSQVYHGPTSFMPLEYDPYADAKSLGIFEEIAHHAFQDVNAGQIVKRITSSRARFEERQRAKGVKAVGEAEARRREIEQERELEAVTKAAEAVAAAPGL